MIWRLTASRDNIRKRILCIIAAISLLIIPSCSQEKKLYKEASESLLKNDLKLDGSNEVLEELIIALNNAEYTEPKNIILMIGDGMGFNIVEATQTVYEDELYNGTLAMRLLPVQGSQTTYSASAQITDSAAGATALATGFKTTNQVVAMDMNGNESYRTVLEIAAEQGKSTGVVATKSVTDATPAAFTAHAENRYQYEDIAKMQLGSMMAGTLDLVLGGGRSYYESEANISLLAKAKKSGLNYYTKWMPTEDYELPMAGIYADTSMDTTNESLPSLEKMTNLALELLSEDEDGFFLMVEGSQIDTYGEKNDFDREVKEAYDFDCAVAVAMRYVALNPDTVLIITADHETGDLEFPANPTKETIKQYTYSTEKHSCKAVPVYAVGYRTEELACVQENTDIGIFIASLLGEDEFGCESTVHELPYEKQEVTFDKVSDEFSVLQKNMKEEWMKIKYARALHITVKNTSDTVMELPKMQLNYKDTKYEIKPQVGYIQPREEIVLSYVFPKGLWDAGEFWTVSEIVFDTDDAEGTIEVSDLQIIERTLYW